MGIPTVAIVGRPNVGKSALFNRLARRQISLVHDRPGVTRDRIVADCVWSGKPFTLIDTGGIGLDDNSGFEQAVQREVALAVQSAEHLLLVVDGRVGVQPLDAQVGKMLRKSGKPVWLVVNKIDSDKQEFMDAEFSELGVDKIFSVSALHGVGINRLMEELSEPWGKGESPRALEKTRIAIVGRPNAGKSTLINAMLGDARLIVSPTAGTTRDAVDIELSHKEKPYVLIDTAGMRKRSRIHDPLEQLMSGRSAHAINRAHLVMLVVDAVTGVGDQEKKIAGLIQEAGRPSILVINKWDLVKGGSVAKTANFDPRFSEPAKTFQEEYRDAVLKGLFFVDYARVVFLSAKEGQGLPKLLDAIDEVRRASETRIPTSMLNRVLTRAMEKVLPPIVHGKRFKLYYAAQTTEGESGAVKITAFVNSKKVLERSYLRYLEGQLRKEFPCTGCPIIWFFKEHETKVKERPGVLARRKPRLRRGSSDENPRRDRAAKDE